MLNILGIETSCDETGVAIVSLDGATKKIIPVKDRELMEIEILSEKLSSSVDLQKEYGGVVPELASRVHTEKINILIKDCLAEANLDWGEIDGIAVASGPGLVGALLVGSMVAKTLAMILDKPMVEVNHLEGHIVSSFLAKKDESSKFKIQNSKLFPALVLIVSGGHTELVLWNGWDDYEVVGSTLDDAAGEAFDKVAKLLGLEYPGGPSISKAAGSYKLSNNNSDFHLPRPMIDEDNFDFSFSGLKTAVLYQVNKLKNQNSESKNMTKNSKEIGLDDEVVARIAWEFQEAVVDVLTVKTKKAAAKFKVNRVAVVGGVAANARLRERMIEEIDGEVVIPPLKYCTDNGTKIALAGLLKFAQGKVADWRDLGVRANWELG